MIASAIVADTGVPPKLVGEETAQEHVRVVKLVIVADPRTDKSPGRLDSRVSREESCFLGLAT